ncbi:MAG: hypothetical protein II970_08280 [Paludibacteraceae bacterium]|nr:hypothetical protein [Paludibacteraceae bacterium]
MIKKLIIISFACIFMLGLNLYAQEPSASWNSTSSMMQSGSSYSSQISPVGAENITYSSMDAPSGVSNRRNGFLTPGDPNGDTESPIGAPYIMLLFTGVAATAVAIRRKKA